MAKRKQWTQQRALEYLMANQNNRGLTYWSAYDYLVRHKIPAALVAGAGLNAAGK